ncbi:MAG: 2-phosphosulfolactate phosphatase [Promethearchaeota archaeon]
MSTQIQLTHATGPAALKKAVDNDHIIILVDVLRASSTIITALANGASSIIPVPTVEEARRLATEHPNAILAGERAAHPPPGFHYGNSPRSFLSNKIRNRPIILTTSNFTRTLGHPSPTATILVGAFLNIEHVAQTARSLHKSQSRPITIISAGGMSGPSIEDDLASDHIAIRIKNPDDPPSYASSDDIARELLITRHGIILVRAGYEEDIYFSSQPNRYNLTPILINKAFYPFGKKQP